jgi:hypothetical protein
MNFEIENFDICPFNLPPPQRRTGLLSMCVVVTRSNSSVVSEGDCATSLPARLPLVSAMLDGTTAF